MGDPAPADAGESACVIVTPVGCLRLRANASALTAIDFVGDGVSRSPAHPILAAAVAAIEDYFTGRSWIFDLPLALRGSPWQLRVWEALRRIPPGDTRTYGRLAAELGSGPRAVAAACRSNPIPIVVPCHRVVAAQGLGGYCGARERAAVEIKHWLLEHERNASVSR
jgi:methylated-DNA-[protein]-cysteine S-methyltransferase